MNAKHVKKVLLLILAAVAFLNMIPCGAKADSDLSVVSTAISPEYKLVKTTIYSEGLAIARYESPQLCLYEVFSYDSEGKLIGEIYDQIDENIHTETSFTYNDAGNLIAEETDHGYLCEYEYDGRGNLTKKTDFESYPDGFREISATCYEYDENGNLKREAVYSYDIEEISDNHIQYNFNEKLSWEILYEYVFNDDGTLKEKKKTTLQGTYQYTETTYYEYDLNGNNVKETIGIDMGMGEELSNPTIYEYDDRNRLISVSYGPGTFPTIYEYDSAGNNTARLTYDLDGDLIEMLVNEYEKAQ